MKDERAQVWKENEIKKVSFTEVIAGDSVRSIWLIQSITDSQAGDLWHNSYLQIFEYHITQILNCRLWSLEVMWWWKERWRLTKGLERDWKEYRNCDKKKKEGSQCMSRPVCLTDLRRSRKAFSSVASSNYYFSSSPLDSLFPSSPINKYLKVVCERRGFKQMVRKQVDLYEHFILTKSIFIIRKSISTGK